MNPSKVLLITLVGPYGEVDVAVRADLPAAELLPAFRELVGTRRDAQAPQRRGSPEPAGDFRRTPQGPPRTSPTGPPRREHGPAPADQGASYQVPPGRPAHWARQDPAGPPAATGEVADTGPRDIRLEGSLTDAGIVDGMVLYLYSTEGTR